MLIERMSRVPCGSIPFFFYNVFIIFAKNLHLHQYCFQYGTAVSCRPYLSQIIHQWPFSKSIVILPHPQLLFRRIQSLCFYFSHSTSLGPYGWSFLRDIEKGRILRRSKQKAIYSLLLSKTLNPVSFAVVRIPLSLLLFFGLGFLGFVGF